MTVVEAVAPCYPLSPSMLDISDVAARFIEDQISWTRVIAHNADLYGKRCRHWFTVELILILVQIVLAWFVLSMDGVYCRSDKVCHNQK